MTCIHQWRSLRQNSQTASEYKRTDRSHFWVYDLSRGITDGPTEIKTAD